MVRLPSGNHPDVTMTLNHITGSRLLVPDAILGVGSPIATATYQLMAGQTVVTLACDPAKRPTFATAIARRLMLNRTSSAINFMAHSAEAANRLAMKVRNRLANYGDEELLGVYDPIDGLRAPGNRHGVFSRSQINVRSGPADSPTGAAEKAHLLVVGFDDQPWRGAKSQPCWDDAVDFRGFTQFPHRGNYGVQVLVLSPAPVWNQIVPRLIVPDEALYEPRGDLPWGEIPLDVLLAGDE